MSCLLCLPEFRDGFAECRDCHLALVPTLLDAQGASVCLWIGIFRATLDKILAALDAQHIPSYFKEIVNAKPSTRIMDIPITAVRTTLDTRYDLPPRSRESAGSD
jgi:hypothetical protein